MPKTVSISAMLSEFRPSGVRGPLDDQAHGGTLPDDYRRFMSERGGGEGFIGENYIVLWSAFELEPFNRAYCVEEFLPGYVLFGTNGGGEGFAFRTQPRAPGVFMVPLIGMEPSVAVEIARSFDAFLVAAYRRPSLF